MNLNIKKVIDISSVVLGSWFLLGAVRLLGNLDQQLQEN
jgi:hypothetical protein